VKTSLGFWQVTMIACHPRARWSLLGLLGLGQLRACSLGHRIGQGTLSLVSSGAEEDGRVDWRRDAVAQLRDAGLARRDAGVVPKSFGGILAWMISADILRRVV
jgi:hypothetical protein